MSGRTLKGEEASQFLRQYGGYNREDIKAVKRLSVGNVFALDHVCTVIPKRACKDMHRFRSYGQRFFGTSNYTIVHRAGVLAIWRRK